MSRKFLRNKGEKNTYMYGETPLTTLDFICRQSGIVSDDLVIDLGCGCGRTSFWLRTFIKCKVIGIDMVPTFIRRAQRIAKGCRMEHIEFREQLMQHVDFKRATAVYLYGTCLEEHVIVELANRLKSLPHRAKIITVSYPLTEYCSDSFRVKHQFSAPFPWGKAEVFVNYIVDSN